MTRNELHRDLSAEFSKQMESRCRRVKAGKNSKCLRDSQVIMMAGAD
jgi:hypothetical protein